MSVRLDLLELETLAGAVDTAWLDRLTGAEEHLPNAPKQQMIWSALASAPPVWAHVPVLVNEARKKLSKRKDDVAIDVSTIDNADIRVTGGKDSGGSTFGSALASVRSSGTTRITSSGRETLRAKITGRASPQASFSTASARPNPSGREAELAIDFPGKRCRNPLAQRSW